MSMITGTFTPEPYRSHYNATRGCYAVIAEGDHVQLWHGDGEGGGAAAAALAAFLNIAARDLDSADVRALLADLPRVERTPPDPGAHDHD